MERKRIKPLFRSLFILGVCEARTTNCHGLKNLHIEATKVVKLLPHEYNSVLLTPHGICISKPTSPPLEQCLTSDIEPGMGGKAVVMLLIIRSLQRRFPKTSRVQSPRVKAGVSMRPRQALFHKG